MARIYSMISSQAQEVLANQDRAEQSEAVESKSNNESPVASAQESGAPIEELDESADRWESADSRRSKFGDSIRGATVGKVTGPVAGPIDQGATEGVAAMAEWFAPGDGFVDTVGEARTDVQSRVRDQIADLSPDRLQEVFERAQSPDGDLEGRIGDRIGRARQQISSAASDTIKSLYANPFSSPAEQMEGRAQHADRVNRILNGVADTVADAVAERDQELIQAGQTLQNWSELGQSDTAELVLAMVSPRAQQANTTARWALDAIGHGLEATPEMAEQLSETPGLPTEDNFDEWIDELEPGEAWVVEGNFVASISSGFGGSTGGGGDFALERCEDDPDRVSVVMGREAEGSVDVGKHIQKEGVSAGVGGRVEGRVQFDFDMSRPDHRQRLAELTLANQAGICPTTAFKAAPEHMVKADLAASPLGDANLGFEVGGLESELGPGMETSFEQREEGLVQRLALNYEGEWSMGTLSATVPEDTLEEMAAQAPTEQERLASEVFSQLSGGHLGATVEQQQELAGGVEINHDTGQLSAYFEGRIETEVMGRTRQLDVEISLRDIQGLAQQMGRSTQDVLASVRDGTVDIEKLVQAAGQLERGVHETVGIKATSTEVDYDGFGVDAFGLEAAAGVETSQQEVLFELGTPIDRSPVDLDEVGPSDPEAQTPIDLAGLVAFEG